MTNATLPNPTKNRVEVTTSGKYYEKEIVERSDAFLQAFRNRYVSGGSQRFVLSSDLEENYPRLYVALSNFRKQLREQDEEAIFGRRGVLVDLFANEEDSGNAPSIGGYLNLNREGWGETVTIGDVEVTFHDIYDDKESDPREVGKLKGVVGRLKELVDLGRAYDKESLKDLKFRRDPIYFAKDLQHGKPIVYELKLTIWGEHPRAVETAEDTAHVLTIRHVIGIGLVDVNNDQRFRLTEKKVAVSITEPYEQEKKEKESDATVSEALTALSRKTNGQ